MPVDNEPNKIIQNSNGTTTTFPFPYKYFNSTDLVVKTITPAGVETLCVLGTDYTITSSDPSAGCSVVFATAPATGTVLIKRVLPLDSDANFRPVSGFPEQVITDSFDASVMRDQDLQEQIKRGLSLPEGSSISNLTIPVPDVGKALKWNGTGTGLINTDSDVDEVVESASASATSASASATSASASATSASASATSASASATASDLSADRAEAAALSLEGIPPTAADEGKFLRAKTPYTAGVEYAEVQGGVVNFNALGATSSNQILNANEITLAAFSGTPTVTLPTITDTSKQVACVLDFTTSTSGYPIINKVKNLTGTIAVTNASATVTGTGTSFSTELQVGDTLVIASVEHKVSAIGSNTSLTLTITYAGTTASGLTVGRKFIRWSSFNQGKPPSAYSILAGIRNILEFKTIWENNLLYWEAKYDTLGGIETAFVQPALSADGALGGSSFAVYVNSYQGDYPAYYMADNNSSSRTITNGIISGTYYLLYNPNALKVSSISMTNDCENTRYITRYTVYGSDDNSNWTALCTGTNSVTSRSATWSIVVNSVNFYKYHKIYVSEGASVDSSLGLTQATLKGTYIAT